MTYQDLLNLPLSAFTPGQGDLAMEGKWETASGAPMYTLEDFIAGLAPYVTGATNISPPSGQLVSRMVGGMAVPVKITDYGPGVGGLDIATRNTGWATDFPYQGQTGGNGREGIEPMYGGESSGTTGALASQDKASSGSGFDNDAMGKAIASAAHDMASKMAQQSQEGMNAAMKMMFNREQDPRLKALMQAPQLAPSLEGGGDNAAMQQLLATYLQPLMGGMG